MHENPDGYLIVDSPAMADRTTIHLGGTAIAEVRLTSLDGVERLPGLLSRIGGRICIMGEGSNVLARDGNLPIVLVSLSELIHEPMLVDNGDHVLLTVSAGQRMPALLGQTANLGLSGLEGLCGIPGSVGGAVAMNAGSHGTEVGDIVHSVELFSPLLGLTVRKREAFDFSYRHCALKEHSGWFVVTAVTFRLGKDERDIIRDRMREFYKKKQASQPILAWTAGCVFKNPAPDAPAGLLLQEAGLRGQRLGGMCFSPVHANFLVNEGEGRFEQALDLIEMAKDKVFQQSGHQLELEVQLWP